MKVSDLISRLQAARDLNSEVLISIEVEGRGRAVADVVAATENQGPKRDTFIIDAGDFEGVD